MSCNPNNCETCDYKQMEYEGMEGKHCYMFAEVPDDVCMQHTARTENCREIDRLLARLLYKQGPSHGIPS